MMVCDKHLNAGGIGLADAIMTGDAIVHRDNQVRISLLGNADNFRGEAIAIFKTVWHQEINIMMPHGTHADQKQGTAGCTVGIKIAYYKNIFTLMNSLYAEAQQRFQYFSARMAGTNLQAPDSAHLH